MKFIANGITKVALILTVVVLSLTGCMTGMDNSVSSPDGKIKLNFTLNKIGAAYYEVLKNNKQVIKPSQVAHFEFKNYSPIDTGLKVVDTKINSVNETWKMQWGEQSKVVNNYNELVVSLEEAAQNGKKVNVYFRVYNDGIGIRYEFPEQYSVKEAYVMTEKTEFQLTDDHTAWWIPGDWDSYERLYNTTKFSEIDVYAHQRNKDEKPRGLPYNAVNTPVTMKTADGVYLSFHEANLTDYPAMTLRVDEGKYKMVSELVGSDNHDYKAKIKLPFKTPWRSIQISDNAGGLVESRLIVNLNDPNKIGDVSYFKPMKYVGIWWELHLDKTAWSYTSGKHGATTENTKKYIDFAAKNGIGGVLVEGWNTGWETWTGGHEREGNFDFVTPYPDYDLEGIVEYAKSKGVEMIMHHETAAATTTYDKQLDTAYALMQKLDLHAVKTGYVGPIIPEGEYHHGQYMVEHYRRVLEVAAKYKVAVNAHEPIKATGIRRTYPNAISREGVRGQEYNAWSRDGGNPPEHLAILPFTRMLAGPIDFTPGVFNISLSPHKPNNQVNTTLAKQLATYVVIYSPIQMACDLPEYYEGNPAFDFIREVGVDWSATKVLDAEIGDYVVIARKDKKTGDWFVGGMTDENSREYKLDFSFLEQGKKYTAKIYKDAADADYKTNPTAIDISETEIDATTIMDINIAPGGGFAISVFENK